jgi:PIN domain nuclease of toxin-antitoxin system
VTVLDPFAVVALLRGEHAAPAVREMIERGNAQLTAVGVAEVVDHLLHVMNVPEEEAALDLAQLGLTEPPTLSPELALLRARHYHRTHRAVSLADCIAAEAAQVRSTDLATADPHLLDLCYDEGIAALPLPDSTRATWSP